MHNGGVMKIDPLDILFSEFIRKQAIKLAGGCQRCGSPKYDIQKENGSIYPAWKQLQCAHLTGRWRESIRWDEENAVGTCGGCHLVLDRDHLEKENFIIKHLGQEKYDLLKARARQTYPKPDKKLLTLYYQKKLLEVKDECGNGS